ncbi:MAG: hypothetical protein ACRC6X_07850 [Culicoidibacterales bacterium]
MILTGIATIIKLNILFYFLCVIADVVIFKQTHFTKLKAKLIIPLIIVIDYLHSVLVMSSASYQSEIRQGFSLYNFLIMSVPTIIILALIFVISVSVIEILPFFYEKKPNNLLII